MICVLTGISLGFILIFAPIWFTSYQILSRKQYGEAPSVISETSRNMSKLQEFKILTRWSESQFNIQVAKLSDYLNLGVMSAFSLFLAYVFSFVIKRRF